MVDPGRKGWTDLYKDGQIHKSIVQRVCWKQDSFKLQLVS